MVPQAFVLRKGKKGGKHAYSWGGRDGLVDCQPEVHVDERHAKADVKVGGV